MRTRAVVVSLAISVVLVAACTAQTAPSPMPETIHVARYPDPGDDVCGKDGRPTIAEAYLDIVETELSLSDGYYTAKITVNGMLPAKMSDIIGWDIPVNTDNDSSTGWNWPLVCDNIGAEYIFRVEWRHLKCWIK